MSSLGLGGLRNGGLYVTRDVLNWAGRAPWVACTCVGGNPCKWMSWVTALHAICIASADDPSGRGAGQRISLLSGRVARGAERGVICRGSGPRCATYGVVAY